MQALSSQVQELGQSAAKIVMDSAKPKNHNQIPLRRVPNP